MAQTYTAHIKVIEARNLKASNSSGFCDPYCKIQLNDDKKKSHKTKVQKKALNPKWQETFIFEGVSKGDKLGVEVRDWNMMNSITSKILGSTSFSLSTVQVGSKPHEVWLTIKDAKGEDDGEVHLLIALATGSEQVDLDAFRLAAHQEVEEGNAVLLVEMLEGRTLAVKDLTGASDPYCILRLVPPTAAASPRGTTVREQRTCIVFRSLEPVWNEEFFFQVPFTNGTLEVEVWDWDRIGHHDAMGMARVSIDKFSDELVHDDWYTLSPIKKEKVSGDIHMRVQFTSALNAQKSYRVAKNNLALLSKTITEENDCRLAMALLQLYESQELARAVVHIFHSQYAVNLLLNRCFHAEIQRTVAETTLFRTDSPATRTTIVFFKLEDKKSQWLSKTLLPLINRVLQSPSGYEVDPEKAKEDKGDVKANVKNLLAVTQQFLDSIIGSLALCPLSIRLTLSNLRRLVTQAFPNSGLMAVGGIIFLRFICPSIFAPEGFGLTSSPPSAEARRSLTLIAKILQNLVNGVEFGGKEQFMVQFNPFIVNNSKRITEFLDRLSQPTTDSPPPAEYAEDELVKSMSVVVKNMVNVDKVETMVMKDTKMTEEQKTNAKAQFTQLREVLSQ